MTISKEILDELLKGVERPEDLLGDAGLMKELKIKLMERMLGAKLTAHLGYEDGESAPPSQSNRRNGTSAEVLKGQDGELSVAIPRDRDSSFEQELVKKGQTRIDGMDDKIIGLYAAGLTVRDIQAHLLDLYGLKVSPDLISRVTAAVLDEVREWQSLALDRMYPIVLFDALRVKIRDAETLRRGYVFDNTKRTSSEGTWRITSNPLAWGNAEPDIVVLGFSKGPTQVGALASAPHNAIAYKGSRTTISGFMSLPRMRDICSERAIGGRVKCERSRGRDRRRCDHPCRI
jgi:hypothetical protein